MRSRYALAMLAVAGVGMMGNRGCNPPDAVVPNTIGFYENSSVLTQRSKKFEVDEALGWWSWLPRSTSLLVSCGSLGGLTAVYGAWYESGDDHLGYSWEDTVEGCLGEDGLMHIENCVVQDAELCAHQCDPWLSWGTNPYPHNACVVRRGYRPDQGTNVTCQLFVDETWEVNTCATDCDFGVAGFCTAMFTHPSEVPGQ